MSPEALCHLASKSQGTLIGTRCCLKAWKDPTQDLVPSSRTAFSPVLTHECKRERPGLRLPETASSRHSPRIIPESQNKPAAHKRSDSPQRGFKTAEQRDEWWRCVHTPEESVRKHNWPTKEEALKVSQTRMKYYNIITILLQ